MPEAFGALTPLLAPRSVAVSGGADRAGNLGGLAVGFLRKFGFRGAVWPVNAGRATVAGVPCFASLAALPGVPDMAILAVPAEAVHDVVQDCIAAGVPSAVRQQTKKPIGLSWLAPPDGIIPRLAAKGVMVFQEHARLIRTAGHLVRYAADLRHRIGVVPIDQPPFPWVEHVHGAGVVTEDAVAAILTTAGRGMTEVIDDVVFSRAPIDADGAEDLLRRLRALRHSSRASAPSPRVRPGAASRLK